MINPDTGTVYVQKEIAIAMIDHAIFQTEQIVSYPVMDEFLRSYIHIQLSSLEHSKKLLEDMT